MNLRRASLIALFFVAAALLGAPAPAQAEDPPYAEGVAPVYMIISFDDTFIVSKPKPSQTIVINIGTFEGADDVEQTRFLVNDELTQITLPEGQRAPTFEELLDNSATVLGSFQTSDLGVHMVTPSAGTIPQEVQDAVYAASNSGALDSLLASDNFPTTEEIAEVIADELPADTTFTLGDVLGYVFNSGQPLSAGDFGASMVGEGDMFPHPSNAPHLFHFRVKVFDDGEVSLDVCKWVGIDVVPKSTSNPVTITRNGELPIAFVTTSIFDATDVDPDTATIGGVYPVRDATFDADDDGDDDLVVYWKVGDLDDAGLISTATTSLTVRADLTAGGCVVGTDAVVVKRPD